MNEEPRKFRRTLLQGNVLHRTYSPGHVCSLFHRPKGCAAITRQRGGLSPLGALCTAVALTDFATGFLKHGAYPMVHIRTGVRADKAPPCASLGTRWGLRALGESRGMEGLTLKMPSERQRFRRAERMLASKATVVVPFPNPPLLRVWCRRVLALDVRVLALDVMA